MLFRSRTKKQVSLAEAALNWQAKNVVAQNQALSKILDNQQKLAKVVTHTFSSLSSLIEDLKKKIKMVEQELATIASTVKDMSVSFPLIGQREKRKKIVVGTTSFRRRFTEGSYPTFPDACLYALPTSIVII